MIADVILVGEYGIDVIQKFENVDVCFLIQNCSGQTVENIIVSFETGEHTIPQSVNMQRRIDRLLPGETELLMVRASTGNLASVMELFLTLEHGTEKYFGQFTFSFMETYKHDVSEALADCRNPYYLLSTSREPSQPVVALPAPRQRPGSRRTAILVYGAGSVAALGTSAYFYISANQLYKNKYVVENSQRATELHRQIERHDMIWKSTLAISAPLIVMTSIKFFRGRPRERSFSFHGLPVRDGLAFTITMDF